MVFIDNIVSLHEDIAYYSQRFPKSHTTYEDLKKALDERENDPVGSIFGYSVSSEWLDKCYGFEIDKVDVKNTYIRYIGTWKT